MINIQRFRFRLCLVNIAEPYTREPLTYRVKHIESTDSQGTARSR